MSYSNKMPEGTELPLRFGHLILLANSEFTSHSKTKSSY